MMKETNSAARGKSPSLVTTDYDNFKTLQFFIDQQHKAEQMIQEIKNFHASFVQSKLVNFRDFVRENPLYRLKLFGKIRFVYREYSDNKRMMLISVDPGNFRILYRKEPRKYLLSKSRQYLESPDLSVEDEQILYRLYRAAFNDPQWDFETNKFTMSERSEYSIPTYDGESMKSEMRTTVNCSLDDTFLITENVMDYINLDVFNKMKAKSMKPYNKRGERYNYYVNSYYPADALFKRDKIEALLRQRFEKEIAVLERAYSLVWKEIAEERYQEMLNGFNGHSFDENTCVMFNNDIYFVSSNPTKYEITMSEDESTIDFYFKDYSISRVKGTEKERTCILTYKTDNNELIDYKTKVRFIKK